MFSTFAMNYKGQDLRPGSPHTFTVDTPLVFQWLPKRYGYPIQKNIWKD